MKINIFVFGFLVLSSGLFGLPHSVAAQGQPLIQPFTKESCSLNNGNNNGVCYIGAENCPGGVDFVGYCNAAKTDACCARRAQTSGIGSDFYCTTTLAGVCQQASRGCGTTAIKKGACQTDAAGTDRVCCQTKPAAPPLPGAPTQTTGPRFGNYTLLEPIPGSANTIGLLNTYLEDIYRFAFWAIGIAVVFMLTIGGFMYLTSAGNTSRMESAKTVIFDAILGLILALVAWLFLYVINPDLVNVGLPSVSISQSPLPPPPVVGGNNQSLAAQIQAGVPGLTLSSAGDCSSSGGVVSPASSIAQSAAGTPVTHCQKGCPGSGICNGTTGLSETMLRGLINVAAQFPITVSSFTGGSHMNGSDHYSGRAADIVPAAPNADWPRIVIALRNENARNIVCDITVAGKTQIIKCDDPRADHIHAAW
ncbi:MAG: pilin [Candidatus Moraniibacteriota bacterium]